MVQEQRRRQQNSLSGAFIPAKRGVRGTRGARGGGRNRGGSGGLVRQQRHLRVSRPRGRPPSSSVKRNLVHRSKHPHHHQHLSDEDEGITKEVDYGVASRPASLASSSPRTDVTEPGATSPLFYSARSPLGDPSGQNYGNFDASKKSSLRKEYQQNSRRQRRSLKMHPPRRAHRRSSLDTSIGPVASPLKSLEADSVFMEPKEEETKPLVSTIPKVFYLVYSDGLSLFEDLLRNVIISLR